MRYFYGAIGSLVPPCRVSGTIAEPRVGTIARTRHRTCPITVSVVECLGVCGQRWDDVARGGCRVRGWVGLGLRLRGAWSVSARRNVLSFVFASALCTHPHPHTTAGDTVGNTRDDRAFPLPRPRCIAQSVQKSEFSRRHPTDLLCTRSPSIVICAFLGGGGGVSR